MMKFLKKLFKKEERPTILFGDQASQRGEHGVLIGRWPRNGHYKEVTIGFYYDGSMLPPPMNPEGLAELFKAAREVGILPYRLYAYGGLMRARCDYDGVPADPKVIALASMGKMNHAAQFTA